METQWEVENDLVIGDDLTSRGNADIQGGYLNVGDTSTQGYLTLYGGGGSYAQLEGGAGQLSTTSNFFIYGSANLYVGVNKFGWNADTGIMTLGTTNTIDYTGSLTGDWDYGSGDITTTGWVNASNFNGTYFGDDGPLEAPSKREPVNPESVPI